MIKIDKNQIEILFLGTIVLLLLVITGLLLKPAPEISVPYVEIRADMQNEAARNTFCKSQGYAESFISTGYPIYIDGTQKYKDYRYVGGMAREYFIVCEKTQTVQQKFDYQTYKIWLIGVGVGNSS